MAVVARAFARAGLLGNPSDGYHGKIVAIAVRNFAAEVEIEESDELRIEPAEEDRTVFRGIDDLAEKIRVYGYYGGARLILAAVKTFAETCRAAGADPGGRNFTIRYRTTIPRQLGLGGSSAIITAAFRALAAFHGIEIPLERLPGIILDTERRELGINAGWMDRVIQVYEGCVFMDLDQAGIEASGGPRVEPIDPALLPPLYLAYKPALGKVSGQVLDVIRAAYERGDPGVRKVLARLAEIAEQGRAALRARDHAALHRLMDENFDLRSRIMVITPGNRELIDAARSCGAAAKYAGSGGSIVGLYHGEEMYAALSERLGALGATVVKPQVTSG